MAEFNATSTPASNYDAALVAFREGNSLVEDGAWKQGLERLRQALDLFHNAEHDVGKAAAFLAIGDVHLRFGDYEVARLTFGDAERLFRMMHVDAGEALAQMKIGMAELYLQHAENAFKYLQAASDYFHCHDNPKRADLSDQLLALAKNMSVLVHGASEEVLGIASLSAA